MRPVACGPMRGSGPGTASGGGVTALRRAGAAMAGFTPRRIFTTAVRAGWISTTVPVLAAWGSTPVPVSWGSIGAVKVPGFAAVIRATVTTVLRWPVPAVTTVFPGTGPAVATVLRRLSPMDTTVLRRIGPTGVVVLRRPGQAALTAATVLRRLVLTAGTGFYGLGPSVTAPTAGTGFCRALSTFMEAAGAVRRTLTAPVVSVFRAVVPTMGELHQVVVSLYPPVSRLVPVVRVFPWRWWYVGRTCRL